MFPLLQNDNFSKCVILGLNIFCFTEFFYEPFPRYSSFCIFKHPMIYQIYYDIMMNICIWDRVYFWVYLLNRNSLSHQNWPINRYKLGQKIFWNLLNNLKDWGYVPGPFQFRNLLKLLKNQLCQEIKNCKILLYCHFNNIIK